MSQIQEIENFQRKLMQTIDILNNFLELHPETQWPHILNALTLLISKYNSILQELHHSSLLKQLILFPTCLIPQDPDFVSRVLLRTKGIPELELPDIPQITINELDEQAVQKALRHWQFKSESHDSLVAASLKAFETVVDEYDFKLRINEEDEDDSDVDMDTDNAVPKLQPEVIAKLQKEYLHQTLFYMHSGPDWKLE